MNYNSENIEYVKILDSSNFLINIQHDFSILKIDKLADILKLFENYTIIAIGMSSDQLYYINLKEVIRIEYRNSYCIIYFKNANHLFIIKDDILKQVRKVKLVTLLENI